MKNSLLLLALLSCCALSAQTKMIAHKSHGGTNADFHAALLRADALLAGSDFGVAPMQEVTIAQLDTVIFISEQEQIIITSACYYTTAVGGEEALSDTTAWQPGTERVYEHELFSQRDRLPWIKRQLDRRYNFTNPADSVVFIGYGEDPPVQEPQPQPAPSPNPPAGNQQEGAGQQPGGEQEPSPRPGAKKQEEKQKNGGQQLVQSEDHMPTVIAGAEREVVAGSVPSTSVPFRLLMLLIAGLGVFGISSFLKK